jgi:hypothetical protein
VSLSLHKSSSLWLVCTSNIKHPTTAFIPISPSTHIDILARMHAIKKALNISGSTTSQKLAIRYARAEASTCAWFQGIAVKRNTNTRTSSSIGSIHIRHKSTNAAGKSNNRPIYIAATQQHVGKTTTCLSLISGLKKRFPHSIGFIKPVGQQHVPVFSELMGSEIRVDKDVTLIREHFQLQHIDYQHMSPVLIPKGTCVGRIVFNMQFSLFR